MIDTSKLRPQSFAGKLARIPLKLIPPTAIMPILQGPMRGSKWITGSSTHGCWIGGYEKDKQVAIASTLRTGSVFFDIGANVGFYTLLASKSVGPDGRVVSFEPSLRNIEYLEKNLAINLVANVTILRVAVCERAGWGGFSLGDHPCGDHLSPGGEIRVRLVSIDSVVLNDGMMAPDCMKIDVEGAETDVLKGAISVIEKYRPTIFLATHGERQERDCLELLRTMKYSCDRLGPDEYVCR